MRVLLIFPGITGLAFAAAIAFATSPPKDLRGKADHLLALNKRKVISCSPVEFSMMSRNSQDTPSDNTTGKNAGGNGCSHLLATGGLCRTRKQQRKPLEFEE